MNGGSGWEVQEGKKNRSSKQAGNERKGEGDKVNNHSEDKRKKDRDEK